MTISKVMTGVPGLDTVLKGGINPNSSVLISGGPGTGKTIFAMQFLLEGAKKREAGLMMLYGTSKEELLQYASSLGLGLEPYVKSGLISIIEGQISTRRFMSLSVPLDIIRTKKIKRIVIDSLTMFSYVHLVNDKEYRREIVNFLNSMKNVTLLATTEGWESNIDELEYKPEHFLFDGVIFLNRVRRGASFERVLFISKMRGQDYLTEIFPFHILKGGIKVYPDQLPFSLMEEKENSLAKCQKFVSGKSNK